MKSVDLKTLDAAAGKHAAAVVALQTQVAAMNTELARVKQSYAAKVEKLADGVAEIEITIREFIDACPEVLGDQRIRTTRLSRFGFILRRHVETGPNTISLLESVSWGDAFLSYKPPTVNKSAVNAAREKVPAEQFAAAEIRIVETEEFFITPNP